MTMMLLSCILMGANFSPSDVEKATCIQFHEKNEKGEIAKNGRFKGQSLPYGSCVLRDEQNKEIVIDFLEEFMVGLKENGVENIYLRLDVIYEYQCNFELEQDFLSRIVKLALPLSISCYEKG